jgi:hypothetical protein
MPRIIAGLGNLYLTELDVTADWATLANVKTDLYNATGIDLIGSPYNLNKDIYFFLWEGSSDPDDIASLKIAKSTGTATWEDITGTACGFSSYPSSGTAYILGIVVVA